MVLQDLGVTALYVNHMKIRTLFIDGRGPGRKQQLPQQQTTSRLTGKQTAGEERWQETKPKWLKLKLQCPNYFVKETHQRRSARIPTEKRPTPLPEAGVGESCVEMNIERLLPWKMEAGEKTVPVVTKISQCKNTDTQTQSVSGEIQSYSKSSECMAFV